MAKKKNKKLSRSKDYLGCISGLISFFDFRYGRSTQRLLSSRGHKNAESPDATGDTKKPITFIQIRQDGDKRDCDDDAESENITMASIRSLVEEGMMKMPKPKKKLNGFVIEQIKQDLGLEESSRKCHEEFINKSGLVVKIMPLVEEFITNSDYYNDAQAHLKHSVYPERIREALERFLSHKHNEASKLKRDGEAQQADVVIDTIQTIRTYKDIFLRLLQEQNSMFVEHIEGSRNAQAKKVSHTYSCKEIKGTVLVKNKSVDSRLECQADSQKPKIGYSKLFGRKRNKQEQNISGVSGGTTHHVLVMKSSQTSARSRFSIEELKKKLKSTIGEGKKERHWLFMTKMPNKQPISDSEESLVETKTISKSPLVREKKNKNVNLKDRQHPERDLMFYIEARKHLMDMLEIDDEEESPTALHIPKTLERIISSTDNISSSSLSPASNEVSSHDEHLSYSGSMQLCPSNCESPLAKIKKLDIRSDVKSQEANFKPDSIRAIEVDIAESEELNAVKSISETVDDGAQELGNSVDTENSSNEESLSTNNEHKEEFTMDSGENMTEEMHQMIKLPALFSTSRGHIDNIDSDDKTVDKSARASPVSVLEPFSSDDDTLETYSAQTEGTFIQPRRILFDVQDEVFITSDYALLQVTSPRLQKEEKEAAIEYVNKVLVISGLNSNKINEDWPFTYSPLDPSLMDHVEASSSQIPDFNRLLFDCINEVILELHKHMNGCWPWISFVGVGIHLIPNGNQAIQKVLKGVAANLATPGQDSVDQTIEKDMAKDRSWMNLCSGVEELEFYIEDSILDKMMEEMILDLWG